MQSPCPETERIVFIGNARMSRVCAIIDKFMTVYAGHIDMPDRGKDGTPANERRFGQEELCGVFGKLERVTQAMDRLGYHSMWMAEHHFQHEGYEVLPNSLMAAVHLCHITE